MAQPAGSITPADFGYDITASGSTRDDITFYSYVYIVCKVDLQPSKWQSVNRSDVYSKHKANLYVNVASGAEIRVAVRTGKETADSNAVFNESGPIAYTWLTAVSETVEQGKTFALPNYNETKVVPRYIIVEARVSRNSTSTLAETVNIFGIYLEAVNDESYTGNDALEFNGDTISKRMNNPFDSLNASMLKDAIAENINKIMYQSRNAFTVPLFGDY